MTRNASPALAARLQWALTTQAVRIEAYQRELTRLEQKALDDRRLATLAIWTAVAVVSVIVAYVRINHG